MHLQHDSTQLMLRDTAERFLGERYSYRTFQSIAASDQGFSADIWAEFARLGWLGLPFAERDGGAGGGAVEVAILMEAFGRALVLEPYLATVVIGGGLVSALGTAAQRADTLPAVAAGKLRLAAVLPNGAPTVAATPQSAAFTLAGAHTAVLSAGAADTLLIAARLPAGGTGVFAVPAATRGLTVRSYRTVDGGRSADLELADVTVPAASLLGDNEDAAEAIAAVADRAIAAAGADAVGAIAAMVAATVDYAKARVQFGQPIAKFQVIQHRLVRMKVSEEEARASALLATLSLSGSPERRARAVSGAKAKVGRSARFVAQNAIQTHGAIGTTRELALGAYARRLMAYEIQFGATREHLRRYAAAIGDPARAADGLLLDAAPHA